MSATATRSPATRRCPFCQAAMAPEQDWCLECGTDVATRVVRRPSWRLPAAIVAGVLLALTAALLVTLHVLSDDANDAASRPARAASPPAPARSAPLGRSATTVARWPAGRRAFTFVAGTTTDQRAAEARARRLSAAGLTAGILRTDGYALLAPGRWVVWAGRFVDRPAAARVAPRIRRLQPGAYVTFVRPRA